MEFNLNNLATVDTTDILQEAVQLSLVDSDVNEVSAKEPVFTKNHVKLSNMPNFGVKTILFQHFHEFFLIFYIFSRFLLLTTLEI